MTTRKTLSYWARIGSISILGVLTTSSVAISASSGKLRGTVRIDGSSTVFPITEAVAEEFENVAPRVRVPVGVSGTGGGFKKLTRGDKDIINASRPIMAREFEIATENGIEFVEVPIAYDGITIVVNKDNYWADSMTVDELRKIFLADRAVTRWSEIREGWPDIKISIYSPGTDSGTFDYFKEVIAGETGSIRSDMSVSENDNTLVNGVKGNKGAIGFFGAAYYFENQDKLRVVPIDGGNGRGAVVPTHDTIENGTYAPFSRPLFIYINKKSLDRPEVEAFVTFYLENAAELAEEVGYVRLPQAIYDRAAMNVKNRKTGTQYLDGHLEKIKGPLPSVYQ